MSGRAPHAGDDRDASSPRAVALDWYAAFNARDLDTWCGLLDEDVEIAVDAGSLRGREAARAYATGILQAYPGVTARLERVVAEGPETVVVESRLVNSAATEAGAAWRLDGLMCEVITVRDARIAALRSYYAPDPADRTGVAQVPSREEAARIADEQAALRRVATLVARGVAHDEVFAAVNEEVARIVGADATALMRFEADEVVALLAAWSAGDHAFPIGARYPLDDALREMRELSAATRYGPQDRPPEGPFFEAVDGLGIVTTLGVPIWVDGRVWGITFAASLRPDAFPAVTEARIGAFTELATAALSNVQARAEVQRLADEQAALRRVAELVARGVAQEELFAAVAAEASRLIEDEPMTLLRFRGGERVTVVASCGGPLVVGTEVVIAGDDGGAAAMARRTGRPVRQDGYRTSVGREFGIGSAVAAPITVEDAVWGILGATTHDHPLPVGTERRLTQFAELVAAALANAQARAEVQQLADEQAALRRVAELVARGVAPAEVFAAVAVEASRLLGDVSTALVRFDEDGASVVVSHHGGPAGTAPPVAAPITVEGRRWGEISACAAERSPAAGTAHRLKQFADLVAAAIANAEHRAQLTASRARVVATADETRRQLQRDVHDGAQQRLVQTVMTLKLAKAALDAGGPVADLLDESLDHAQRATDELRDLVRGILPAALTRGGLRAGIESLVGDIALPVEVQVTAPRLPAGTETTAYFVVAEALTNVVKHSRATRAHIRAGVETGTLRIDVHDDGVGGADPLRGSGLMGLSDRVLAGRGTLTITSPAGEGTSVSASLPLGPGQ